MHSNRYTFIYAAIMTIIVAVILAFSSEGLRPAQEANIALEKKINILTSVKVRNIEKKQYVAIYEKNIKEITVDYQGNEVTGTHPFEIDVKGEQAKKPEERKMPVFVYSADDGRHYYIVPVRGAGLWGPIWGYISLVGDGKTIYSSFFDHKGETPGLGAEINTEKFQHQFEGKQILDAGNQFVSVRVLKGQGNLLDEHSVDGISGGTITSRGTDKMLKEGLAFYLPYFNKIKSTN